MSITQVNGRNIKDGTIQKKDVDIVTPGQSLITNAIPGSNIIITQTGADIGTGATTISTKRSIYATIGKNGNINPGAWLNAFPGNQVSGSYSGYPSTGAFIIPYNCHLENIKLVISAANFDYRSSSGPIYVQLGIFSHKYNGASQTTALNLEIPGSFRYSSFSGVNTTIDTNTWTLNSGTTTFTAQNILGFMYLKNISQVGQTSRITNAYILFEFKED